MATCLLEVLDDRLERLGVLLLVGDLALEVGDDGILGVDLGMWLAGDLERQKWRKWRCSDAYLLGSSFDGVVELGQHLDRESGFDSVVLEAKDFELYVGHAGLQLLNFGTQIVLHA